MAERLTVEQDYSELNESSNVAGMVLVEVITFDDTFGHQIAREHGGIDTEGFVPDIRATSSNTGSNFDTPADYDSSPC